MKVTVEIITGTWIDNEVKENATVRNLKEKIAAELKLPANRLILLVGEDERRRIVMDCEDENLLADLGVRDGSHMYLFFKHLDLVSREERNRGGGEYVPMEDILVEAEMRREKGGEATNDEMELDEDEEGKRDEECKEDKGKSDGDEGEEVDEDEEEPKAEEEDCKNDKELDAEDDGEAKDGEDVEETEAKEEEGEGEEDDIDDQN